MNPQRIGKPLIVLLSAIAALLTMPPRVDASTYNFPLRTATMAVGAPWYYTGDPEQSCQFWIDPPILRVGYDPQSGLVYESFVVADMGETWVCSSVGVDLHLATLTASSGAMFSIHLVGVEHPVPELMDFTWRALALAAGDLIPEDPRAFGEAAYAVEQSGSGRYQSWFLGQYAGYGEFAGVPSETNAPFAEIHVVPEPSTLGALLCGMFALVALGFARRGDRKWIAVCSVLLCILLVGPSFADEWFNADSEPGVLESAAKPPAFPSTRDLPGGYAYLPTLPKLLWSFGCGPTSAAMICGYLDNSGFPAIWTDSNYPVFPTTTVPSDNYIFLRRDANGNLLDSAEMYPSRCALSASEMGVFGLTERGHVDDYFYYAPFTDLAQANATNHLLGVYDGYCKVPGGTPQWTSHENIEGRGRDCLADYVGASAWYYRGQTDGNSQYIVAVTGSNPIPFGTSITWQPYAWPHPNVSGASYLDANYGLTRYIVEHAGYYCKTTEWTADGTPYSRNDVDSYYNRGIKGAGLVDGEPNTEGVGADDVKAEIEAGWPILAMVHSYLYSSGSYIRSGGDHVFPVFGYKEEQIGGVDRLWLLAYDTWYQDGATQKSYSTLLFPTQSEAQNDQIMSLTRYGISPTRYYKLYAFVFMHVNGNSRCPDPLDSSNHPSGNYEDEFDLDFDLGSNVHYIHYDYARDPNPDSPTLTLDSNGQATYHVEHDCSMYFRTYRDAEPPNGYLASRSIHRLYSVWTANKNIKRLPDEAEVTMVNGIVTHVVDDDNFYFEEKDKRLFGIRVNKAGHGLQVGDEVESVVGAIKTDTNGERYIDATSVTEPAEPSAKTIEPLCLTNRCLGGADFNYNSTTGAGQQGITGGAGLNNIGLLVRTTGCVCSSGTSTFSITDGSGAPVKVVVPSGVTAPDTQTYVGVTGISSCEVDGEDLVPVLLVHGQDDITDYAQCEACGGESRGNAPIRQWPEPPVYEGTDTVAWAVGQSDGTAVAVVGAYVTKRAADGLSVVDIRPQSSAAMRVLGNWDVPPWGTVDVSGIVTTLSDGTRAVVSSQLLVYTDASGRLMPFPISPRGPAGQPMPEWPHKRQASTRSM